ncbi:fasciclin domain-containing protein [Gynurincola endophyticus]|uniref:fasciclin domain-containing protein n=1 Tax=Gynurincola endophyticus TaxID=2479004 RepID=UPI000F8D2D72|nr:fasciclin domain-containing protein [Gynurincola endophyticus]
MKYRKLLYLPLCGMLAISGCIKNTADTMSNYDNNRINMVVADNFNLSSFNAALRRSALDQDLQKGAGPYTVLAPSDIAFGAAGYPNAVNVLTANATIITRIANYHTLDGKYELNKLPFLFNQELRSRGGKMYATHWIKGQDTVLTINGSRVVAKNIPASNGLIQVIDRVLTPYLHNKLGDAVAAEHELTLFTQALISSGMLADINEAGPFTIFAPANNAMIERGYASVQQIKQTDIQQLRDLVSYHIVNDRRFIYDYILSAGSSNASKQAMFNGNTIDIKLVQDPAAPGSFSTISLRGIGNTSDIAVSKRDILTGNGVLHIINGSLRQTQ